MFWSLLRTWVLLGFGLINLFCAQDFFCRHVQTNDQKYPYLYNTNRVFGQFLNCRQPQMQHLICSQDKLKEKLNTKSLSVIFNKEDLLHKYTLYIYIYIYICEFWFSLVWFYGISTILGHLMPNRLYTCTLNMYVICKHIL